MSTSPTIDQLPVNIHDGFVVITQQIDELCDNNPLIASVVNLIHTIEYQERLRKECAILIGRASRLSDIWFEDHPRTPANEEYEQWLTGQSLGTITGSGLIEGTELSYKFAERLEYHSLLFAFRLLRNENRIVMKDVMSTWPATAPSKRRSHL